MINFVMISRVNNNLIMKENILRKQIIILAYKKVINYKEKQN